MRPNCGVSDLFTFSITQIWLDKNDRRRRKWLQEANFESVLVALTKTLYEGGRGVGPVNIVFDDAAPRKDLKRLFENYGEVKKPGKNRYWTTKDLHQFLQNRFGKSKELEGSMPLLWRCFQFHAYFPFVIDSPHSIDWGGFQRAIAFLAADGEEKLGFDAIGEIIDHRNREFYSLRRMYRSMAGRYKGIFRQSACMDHDFSEWSCEGDLLDILALVQPGHPSIRTVRREEMKEHADRILGPLDGYNYAYIPYNELMNLIKLLLSFRLEKPQRGAPFNTACPRDQVDEGLRDRLAKAIMDQFTAQVSVDVQWSSFERALKNYVPNLSSQMRLLFTSFLSPTVSITQTKSRDTDTILSPSLTQYLYLLQPSYRPDPRKIDKTDNFEHFKAHYILQETPSIIYSSQISRLSLNTFLTSVAKSRSQTILLISGMPISNTDEHTTRVIFAVHMSSPLASPRGKISDFSEDQSLHYVIGSAQGIYQLEPQLKILRPRKPETETENIVKIHILDGDEALRFGEETSSGLTIAFGRGVAMLQSVRNGNGYFDVGREGDDEAKEDWTTEMHIENLEVYLIDGSI